MLSRFYLLFIGMVLLVLGITGYLAPNFITGDLLGAWTPTVWLLTGIVALAIALLSRSVTLLRWTSGIIGAAYVLWGLIALYGEVGGVTTNNLALILFIMGALGLAAALAPAYWVREQETYAPART